MNKTKFFGGLAIIMVCLNLVLIFFILKGRPHHFAQLNGPKELIVEKLDFSKSQADEYFALIENHQLKVKTLNQEINERRSALFALLKSDNDSTEVSEIIMDIAALQAEIEKVNYAHFKDVKKICTQEQLANFNKLTDELVHMFNIQRVGEKGAMNHVGQ